MSRVFSYFLKIFFHASPTYASFSPLFVRLFAPIPAFPQLLVLSFPRHHNRCSRLSLIGPCEYTISVPILFADRKSVFQELTFCGESRPTSPNMQRLWFTPGEQDSTGFAFSSGTIHTSNCRAFSPEAFRATLSPFLGDTYADSRRSVVPALRIHPIGIAPQTYARRGSLRSRLRLQKRRQ